MSRFSDQPVGRILVPCSAQNNVGAEGPSPGLAPLPIEHSAHYAGGGGASFAGPSASDWWIPPPGVIDPRTQKPWHWISIELIYEDDGSPVPGEEYCITLPDQSEVRGFLDREGKARVGMIEDPGQCEITFPNQHRDAWRPG
ncbi:MAG: hypothetical protein ACRCZF_24060 [Gemmataceae bacterium]